MNGSDRVCPYCCPWRKLAFQAQTPARSSWQPPSSLRSRAMVSPALCSSPPADFNLPNASFLWRHVMRRAEWMTGRVLHLQKVWKFPGRNICGRAAGHCPSGCELWSAVHKDADVLSVELPVFETAESLLPSTPPAVLIHQNLLRHPLRPSF